MATNWLEVVLLAPWKMGTEASPQGATSVLLDGGLGRYMHVAKKNGWPTLDQMEMPGRDYRLPAALLRHLAGIADPDLLESSVAEPEQDPGERVLSAALVSLARADGGATHEAIAVLLALVDATGLGVLELAFVHNHLSLRYLEAGSWDEARQSCEAVSRLVAQGQGQAAVRAALRAISASNASAAAWYSEGRFGAWPLATRDHLARVDQLTANALEHDLGRSFDARFRDAGTRSITFASEDSADSSLLGALLRSEMIGDLRAILRARKNLGRYRLMAAAGADDHAPDSGFALLLRAGDAEGLAKCARVYLADGPLSSIAAVVGHVAESRWTPLSQIASLRLVSQAADVLTPEQAGALLARLCSDYARIVRPIAASRADFDALEAIAALARVAHQDAQTIAAEFALSLANKATDGLTLQTIPRVLWAIDWSDQPSDIFDRWIAFVAASLIGQGDRSLLAEEVVFSALTRDPKRWLSVLRSAGASSAIIALAALEGGIAGDLTAQEALAASQGLVEVLAGIRQAAAHHSFSFGERYDAGAFLAELLLARPELTQWGDLMEYLADRSVPPTHTANALEVIARSSSKLSITVQDAIRSRFNEICADREQGVLPAPEYEAGRLILGDALGLLSGGQVAEGMLRLASSADPALRVQASRCAAFVKSPAESVSLTVALLLSRDSDVTVRGTASRSLVGRVWLGEQERALVWSRAIELLSAGGREPTLGVLRGLSDLADAQSNVPRALTSRVERLAADHVSWLVRSIARRLAAEWSLEPLKDS